MPNILKFTLQISLYYGLVSYCTLQFIGTYSKALPIFREALSFISLSEQSIKKQSRYCLQNRAYSKKHSTYCLKVLKSSLNNIRSTRKPEKAFNKLSLELLFSMFIGLLAIFLIQFYSIYINLIQLVCFNLFLSISFNQSSSICLFNLFKSI